MGFYLWTGSWTPVTGYIPAMTSDSYQGFLATASSLLSGYYAYYPFDQQSNTAYHSSIWSGWVFSSIAVPDEISVEKLYITSRNDASNPRYPNAFYLQGKAVGWQYETIIPETSLNFTAPNQTLEFTVSNSGKYSYLRLYLQRRSSYVAINEWQVDATVYWPKPPSPSGGTDFDFTSMTAAEMQSLFPYTSWGVTFVEWKGVGNNSGKRTAWLLIDGIGANYSWIEIYYSGYRDGSAGYLCWINDTFETTTSSDWKNLALYWWTYDGSNTAWGAGGSYFTNVSSYHAAHHKHSLIYDFSSWNWTALYDDDDYASWTYGGAATLETRLSWQIYFQLCGVNNCWIETAGYRLIP